MGNSLLRIVTIVLNEQTYTLHHRLQLSRNLRDSPGFLEFVLDPGTLLNCPGRVLSSSVYM